MQWDWGQPAMAFTFAAFCYMLSLVLCAALIFFAIWHVSNPLWSLFFCPNFVKFPLFHPTFSTLRAWADREGGLSAAPLSRGRRQFAASRRARLRCPRWSRGAAGARVGHPLQGPTGRPGSRAPGSGGYNHI